LGGVACKVPVLSLPLLLVAVWRLLEFGSSCSRSCSACVGLAHPRRRRTTLAGAQLAAPCAWCWWCCLPRGCVRCRESHPNTACALTDLAAVQREQSKFEEAEANASRAVASLRRGVGAKDVSTATALYVPWAAALTALPPSLSLHSLTARALAVPPTPTDTHTTPPLTAPPVLHPPSPFTHSQRRPWQYRQHPQTHTHNTPTHCTPCPPPSLPLLLGRPP
jgi:hypothetical protein